MIGQPQSGSLVNQILDMKKQGLTNNQIIQNMQRAGFTNTQVFDALNQIETKNAVEGLEPMGPPGGMHSPSMPALSNSFPQPSDHQPIEGHAQTEELIEAIIDEKWSDLIENVKKVVEWKNRAEQRISAVELKIENLKDSFDQLHKAVIGKISEYDRHILDVGTEIQAMEKVFSKVLPSFTENVHELSRITENIKKE